MRSQIQPGLGGGVQTFPRYAIKIVLLQGLAVLTQLFLLDSQQMPRTPLNEMDYFWPWDTLFRAIRTFRRVETGSTSHQSYQFNLLWLVVV